MDKPSLEWIEAAIDRCRPEDPDAADIVFMARYELEKLKQYLEALDEKETTHSV